MVINVLVIIIIKQHKEIEKEIARFREGLSEEETFSHKKTVSAIYFRTDKH